MLHVSLVAAVLVPDTFCAGTYCRGFHAALANMGKECKPSCKWCAAGECWTSGQIERDPDYVSKSKKGPKKNNKGKAKGGAAAPAKATGNGSWVFVPAGRKMPQVQKQFLKQAVVNEPQKQSPKTLLINALQLPGMLDSPYTKDETLVFDMVEENGKHTATLNITGLTSAKTDFKGKPGATEKEAQANACQKALNICGKEIKVATAAHAEVKAEREKARAELLKEKKAAKKAEKDAAA